MLILRFIPGLYVLLLLKVSCGSPQTRAADPVTGITESSVEKEVPIENISDTLFLNPVRTVEISGQISETSGLIMWNGLLWTQNDDEDTRLYGLDTLTGEIIKTIQLHGVENQDWEEISQDKEYIYVGDIGNNSGNRQNLHILRIDKATLVKGIPAIDTIWFSYSNQQNFESPGVLLTEFDCEAFVVSPDSIYLFTKQWSTGYTTMYSLPKLPGSYIAQKGNSFNTNGQVTGAAYLEEPALLILTGYSGLIQPFVYLFYEYQGYGFFTGKNKRVNLSLPFHQIEAVAASNGSGCYISNERATYKQMINIPPKLHFLDLSGLLAE